MGWLTSILSIIGSGLRWGLDYFTDKNKPAEVASADAKIEEQVDVSNTKDVQAQIDAGKPKK